MYYLASEYLERAKALEQISGQRQQRDSKPPPPSPEPAQQPAQQQQQQQVQPTKKEE
jgi:hypothetical protein